MSSVAAFRFGLPVDCAVRPASLIEVVSVDIVNVVVSVIIDSLDAVEFGFIYPHRARKIGMSIFHRSIADRDDDVRCSCSQFPCVYDSCVSAFACCCRHILVSGVVEVPLV